MDYDKYLQTVTWRKRRDAKLLKAEWRCERCRSRRELNVHHRTYARLGAELDSDLEVLCRGCHESHHQKTSAAEHIGLYIKLVADVVRLHPDVSEYPDLLDLAKTFTARRKIPYNSEKLSRALDVALKKRTAIQPPRIVREALSRGYRPPISDVEAVSILRQLGLTVGLRTIPKGYGTT